MTTTWLDLWTMVERMLDARYASPRDPPAEVLAEREALRAEYEAKRRERAATPRGGELLARIDMAWDDRHSEGGKDRFMAAVRDMLDYVSRFQ